MEYLDILRQIFDVCIIPLMGILTAYIVKYIKAKSNEITLNSENETLNKYVILLTDTISQCVIATNQTYVESLKKENAFDYECQKNAFKQTYDAVMNILTDDAKKYLSQIYGDLNAYIQQRIEAEVKLQK